MSNKDNLVCVLSVCENDNKHHFIIFDGRVYSVKSKKFLINLMASAMYNQTGATQCWEDFIKKRPNNGYIDDARVALNAIIKECA